MKIKKLNEELLIEYAQVIVPINVKFRTTSPDEDELIYYEEDKITYALQDKFEYKTCSDIDKFLKNKQPEIEKQLGKKLYIYYSSISLNEYNNVMSADGFISIEIEYEDELEMSSIKNVFNTLLNDALINSEVTIEYESDEYGECDIIAEINKSSDVEVEDY